VRRNPNWLGHSWERQCTWLGETAGRVTRPDPKTDTQRGRGCAASTAIEQIECFVFCRNLLLTGPPALSASLVLLFFAHVEFKRQRVGTRLFTVPTEAQVRSDFSQTRTAAGALIPVFDPFSNRPNPANASQIIRDQFPGNVIPQARL